MMTFLAPNRPADMHFLVEAASMTSPQHGESASFRPQFLGCGLAPAKAIDSGQLTVRSKLKKTFLL